MNKVDGVLLHNCCNEFSKEFSLLWNTVKGDLVSTIGEKW